MRNKNCLIAEQKLLNWGTEDRLIAEQKLLKCGKNLQNYLLGFEPQ